MRSRGITSAYGRITMRLLAVASVLSVLVAAATFACSSSDPVTPAADAGKDAKAAQTTDDDDDQTNTDPDAGDQVPVTDPDAGDLDADAGPTLGTTDAGRFCKANSVAEVEPNNTEATATAVPEGADKEIFFCGQVVKDDPDVFTFETPDFGGRFDIDSQADNNVNFHVELNGDEFDTTNFGGVDITTGAGDKWVVTVSTPGQNGKSYSLRIHKHNQ